MVEKQKPYAFLKHPLVAEAIGGKVRFATPEQALEYLEALKNSFKISRHQPKQDRPHSLIIWVKGYELTTIELLQGMIGNYALISPVDDGKGAYKLYTTKLPAEIKHHPQRKRPKQRQPDWGNGILRHIRKGKIFATIEEAHGILERLHDEYPEISRAGMNKLFIMIYSRTDNPKQPVQRYILEIKPHKNGGFIVEYKLNQYKPNKKIPNLQPQTETVQQAATQTKEATPTEKAPTTPKGYFTSMVDAKRKKKKIGS